MCEYLKRMRPQGTPTDDIREWSALTHSVVEYAGPKPFGMDGNVKLWLHENSATLLLDMCDELDAKFAKLKELAKLMHETIRDLQETFDASVVVGGVELSAEYFETELNKLGIEVNE